MKTWVNHFSYRLFQLWTDLPAHCLSFLRIIDLLDHSISLLFIAFALYRFRPQSINASFIVFIPYWIGKKSRENPLMLNGRTPLLLSHLWNYFFDAHVIDVINISSWTCFANVCISCGSIIGDSFICC